MRRASKDERFWLSPFGAHIRVKDKVLFAMAGTMVAKRTGKTSKYTPELLIQAFKKAAVFRNQVNKLGFPDNGGAIHSAERILNILGLTLVYPGLGHINNLRKFERAIFSVEALDRHTRQEKVLIEHVSPLRHFTQQAIAKIVSGASDEAFKRYVKRHYRLVLLTPEQTTTLNLRNRSKMDPARLDGFKFIFQDCKAAKP